MIKGNPAKPEDFAGMERAMGVEPTSKAWEAFILPMNYARIQFILYSKITEMQGFFAEAPPHAGRSIFDNVQDPPQPG